MDCTSNRAACCCFLMLNNAKQQEKKVCSIPTHLLLNSLDRSKDALIDVRTSVFPRPIWRLAIKGRFSTWQRPVAPAPILGGPERRAGEELRDNLAATPRMNAQKSKIHSRKVRFK